MCLQAGARSGQSGNEKSSWVQNTLNELVTVDDVPVYQVQEEGRTRRSRGENRVLFMKAEESRGWKPQNLCTAKIFISQQFNYFFIKLMKRFQRSIFTILYFE